MAQSRILGPDGQRLRYRWEGNGDGRVNVASDPDDEPAPKPKKSYSTKSAKYRHKKAERIMGQKMLGAINTYLDQLSKSRLPAEVRAMDPFSSHVWVFAAAMTVATVAGQAPFGVFRESDRQQQLRRAATLKHGYGLDRVLRAGKGRGAMKRYSELSGSRRAGLRYSKTIEQDLNHPANDVFSNPNPLQDGQQLLQLTHLWMAVRGECFWVLTDAEGNAVAPGQYPERIWPLGPDCFQPAFEYGTFGDLIGWYYQPPCYMPNASQYKGSRIFLSLPEVVQFKYPNPMDPVRGMSRITAAAMGIESDLLIKTYNRSLLKNQGAPRGILTYAGNMKKADEEAYMRKWKEKFEGEDNVGKVAMLQAGFQYQNIGLSQEDMQYIEQLKLDRDEVLAVMGMPASVLGVTEFSNYATQLGQDKNLWDKNLIPLFKLEESAIDRSIFFNDLDNVFALFDLTDVEALRAGLLDKVNIAAQLAGPNLRVPPSMAFEKVGLEMDQYKTDDVSFVPPLMATAESIVESSNNPAPSPSPNPGAAPAGGETPPAPAPAGDLPASTPPGSAIGDGPTKSGVPIQKAKLTWVQFLKYQGQLERATMGDYRKWINVQRKETLARFDEQARGKSGRLKMDLTAVIPDPTKAAALLRQYTRPAHAESLEQLYGLAKEEFGVPIFDVTDDRLLRAFTDREKFFAAQTVKGVNASLSHSLAEGTKLSESVQELRDRIATTYDIQAGSSKTLTVARTESAGFVNGIRNEMIGAQGFEMVQWTSAGDVVVRDDHTIFDEAGPKPRGFDYMSIAQVVTDGGVLTFPHDMRAPAGQVINCRCFQAPVATEKQRAFVARMIALRARGVVSAAAREEIMKALGLMIARQEAAPVLEHRCEHGTKIIQPIEVHVHNEGSPVPKSIRKDIVRDAEGRSSGVIETPVY